MKCFVAERLVDHSSPALQMAKLSARLAADEIILRRTGRSHYLNLHKLPFLWISLDEPRLPAEMNRI